MPGDVESIGAERGVPDMDEVKEIRQLTQLLDVEQDTGIAEVTTEVTNVSSDEESDGDKDSREDPLYPCAFMKKDYYTMPHYLLLNFDSGTKMTQVTNIIVK